MSRIHPIPVIANTHISTEVFADTSWEALKKVAQPLVKSTAGVDGHARTVTCTITRRTPLDEVPPLWRVELEVEARDSAFEWHSPVEPPTPKPKKGLFRR